MPHFNAQGPSISRLFRLEYEIFAHKGVRFVSLLAGMAGLYVQVWEYCMAFMHMRAELVTLRPLAAEVDSVTATETRTSAALLKRQAREIDKVKEQRCEKG
jgi:hypothetical protein